MLSPKRRGQRDLAIRLLCQRDFHGFKARYLLADAAIAACQMHHSLGPRFALFLPVDTDHLVDIAFDLPPGMSLALM